MRKRTIFACILIVIAIILGLYLLGQLHTYTDYTVTSTVERTDDDSTKYEAFGSNLIKYGSDGISCTDLANNILWSQSFEMDQPVLAKSQNYVAVAERSGTVIYIFNQSGYAGKVDTNRSILQIDVSDQGTLAVIEEKSDVYYLELYRSTGDKIASGEIHMDNSGYPMAMSLSPDGTLLGVAFASINSGSLTSTVTFYNFDSVGKSSTDNIVATYSYEDDVIGQVEFLNDKKMVAFGENQVRIYSGNEKPQLAKTIELDGEVTSVFYGNDRFGVIYRNNDVTLTDSGDAVTASGDQASVYEMKVYNASGRKIYTASFNLSYKQIQVLSDGQVAVMGDNSVELISKYGIERFRYTFSDEVYVIFSEGGLHSYELVMKNHTDKIELK